MERVAKLSPEKQLLLVQRLKGAAQRQVECPVIPKRPNPDSAPLSFAQSQMWVIDQMTPGNPAYNLPVGYRLKGKLDTSALEASFNEIIKRHEALRTTFAAGDGEAQQVIHPECNIKINLTELGHLTGQERDPRLHLLASEESVRSFDLSRLPLIRVSLYKLGEAEHVLIINLHHIVADGLSVGLLLDELDTFYRAFTGGSDARPREFAVQYGDFALWQQRSLANESGYAKQIEFWQKQLAGTLPVLELPGDRPRPALQSFNGANVFFNIHTDLAMELKSLGAREGCTFFMTALAAFQVLLQRYSGAEDIVIGTPVAVRTPREVEPLIGNFLNMAAFRCDLSGDPTFIELLRRSRDTVLDAFSNSDLPFGALMKHLKFERDPSRNPIFQGLLQVLSNAAPRIGDLEISSFHFDLKFAQFDLSLHLYEQSGGYLGRFEYCSDLFDAQTIRRLCGHFETILEAIVHVPNQSISKLPMLTDAERQQLVVEWNSTAASYPRKDLCLHQMIEEQAGRTPEQVAAVFERQALTYGELNRRANQLARHLRGMAVGPDVLVALFVERSLEMVVGIVGILKAGGAYVPIDPSYPKERLGYILEASKAAIVITQKSLVAELPGFAGRSLCLDADWAEIACESGENLVTQVKPEHLAYVLFTSGSTGRPKGVALEHRTAATFVQWAKQVFTPQELAAVLFSTSVCFDLSVFEMFVTLGAGGKIILARNALDLPSLPEKGEVTLINTVPSAITELLRMGAVPASVKTVNLAGEALSDALVEQIYANTNCEKVYNLYGPTETTTYSTYTLVRRGCPVTIGRPIADTHCYILDARRNPVPIGVIGELYIAGGGLARGYYARPELTNERFVANPFSEVRAARMYRTGDLCRWLPDGNIQHLGRMDRQVKLRGFRIELGEIEHVLAQDAGVKDAAVMIWEDHDGDKRLVAYYIPAAATPLKAGDVRKVLQDKLPAYMIPSFFVEMESFPLTPNGKIDRRSFPEPEISKLESAAGYVAPHGELEVHLAEIWRKALNVERIGVNDNFFELGGHSLLAAQLFAQIERKLGMNLPLAILFQAPSIRQLSEKIKQNAWESSWSSLVPIQPQGDKPALFLIHGAEGNVLLYDRLAQKLGKDQPLYGLQSRGLDGHEPMESEIESMAAKYLEEIKLARPKGPYYIGGYCLGGTIALEVAQQLRRAGDVVALLAMIETYNLQSRPPVSFSLKTIHKTQNLYFQVRNLLLSLSEGTFKFFTEKFRIEIGRLRVKWDILYSQFFNRFHPGRHLGYQHLRIKIVNHNAQAAYRPAPYGGKIILFRPKVFYRRFNDRSFGWGAVAKQGVEVVELPNYPKGLLNDPFVDVLADRLKAEIEKVRDGSSSPRGSTKHPTKGIMLCHSFISYFHFVETECPALLDRCAVGSIIC